MSDHPPKFYRDDPNFADIKPLPLPQQTGDPFYINYSEEYIDLFGYFMALVNKEEISERALSVAERVINRYSNHYTAWWYKYHILETLKYDLDKELDFITNILTENPKSYQAWHYRQWLIDRATEFHDELPFLVKTFIKDSKNFHAWSYSIWYAERWNQVKEIYNLAVLQVRNDSRNNSAWNARRTLGEKLNISLESEFEAVEKSLLTVGKNESACNFAMALVDKDQTLKQKLKDLALKMIEKNNENVQALRLLIYVANLDGDAAEISSLCEKLMKLDPIRIPYYTLLKSGKIKFQ
ncbi:prenyltransferase alpha subunit [Tritrichomonas foetus]|uniref:Protein farnesyltransferase/geranylgeranyltransferase type-1 subunit alpha n=1 Tax=Tritrichomonas foetus TaxID=1144522 RepID=A0A1J4K422_9EUKA|nr:prenyltransferase alpha subunit [Tritrichomonas foetus]|eukprot:OHT04446.1 prenyltransferase alpha subunit [Tritrichomonas foetus]